MSDRDAPPRDDATDAGPDTGDDARPGPVGAALRDALRGVPAPVVVVTAEADGVRRAATIGSFASVALEPALVSFNVTRRSRLHAVLLDAHGYAVHLLAADQAALAARFAAPGVDDPLDGFEADDRGVPVLPGTLGTLVCAPYTRITVGDHSLFVGAVEEVRAGRAAPPLLYHGRRYGTVAPLPAPGSPVSSPGGAPVSP